MADTYEKDGLLYCAKCNTPLQCKYTINGETRIVRVSCECAENARREERLAEERKIEQDRIERNREAAFCDKRLLSYTFANDDGENGKLTVAATNYVEHFDELAQKGKGLLFYGGVGVGKTFYAGCIANALIDKGYTVIFTNFSAVASAMFGADKQGYVDKLARCDLLVLDDLAAERDTEYMGEIVQTIIDKRYMNDKPIIVTTNLTASELKSPQGIRRQRVYSRLFEMCLPIEVAGDDRRRKKLVAEYENLKKLLGV